MRQKALRKAGLAGTQQTLCHRDCWADDDVNSGDREDDEHGDGDGGSHHDDDEDGDDEDDDDHDEWCRC